MRAIQKNSKNASNIEDGLRSLRWVCLARLLIQQMTGNMLADWWAIWQSREMSIEWMVDENWERAQSWERRRVWECVRGREGIITVWERGGTGGAGYTERGTERPNVPTFDTKLHQTSFPQIITFGARWCEEGNAVFIYTSISILSTLVVRKVGQNQEES